MLELAAWNAKTDERLRPPLAPTINNTKKRPSRSHCPVSQESFSTNQEGKKKAEEWVDVSLAQDGGVMKKVLKEAPEGASGPPPNGFEVEAHYIGTC